MCGVDIFTVRKQLLNILSLKKCAPSGVTPVGALLGVILRGGWEHFLYEYLTGTLSDTGNRVRGLCRRVRWL